MRTNRRAVLAAGAALAWLGGAVRAAEPTGRWVRAETPHFVVYSADGEREARDYALMLEDFDGMLRRFHRLETAPAGRKLPVYLLRDREQLLRIFPDQPNALGVYTTALQEIFVAAIPGFRQQADNTRGDEVILHEYVHHFMMQYFPVGYPSWLSEGLPEYYATADLGPRRVFVGEPNNLRAYSLLQRAWVPMEDLLGKRPGQVDEMSRSVFYGQAWLLTHYVWSDDARRALLDRYLEKYRDGQDPVKAWAEVYGDDPRALQTKLKAYMNRRLPGRGYTREGRPDMPITVTAMPAGADDLLIDVQLLKRHVSTTKVAQLARIRAAAAKRPDERFSRMALARAETQYGDHKAGEAMLDALLAERPDDLEALQLAAISRLNRAERKAPDAATLRKEASAYLGRANKVDPDNYLTLYSYARAQADGDKPSENTLNVLARAVELAPQQPSVRLAAGRAFITAGQLDEARFLLEPAAANPHGGGVATVAQKMLDEIDAKEKAAAKPG